MGRELTPAEVRELLGAYALDAVDGDERDEVERYVERSPDARLELAELREVTSLLVQPEREAPDTLWERIEEALAVEPPALAIDAPPRPRERGGFRRLASRRLALAGTALAVAALTVTVVLLARHISSQDDRITELATRVEHGNLRDAALAMAADPRARSATLSPADGALRVHVVAMPDGSGFLMGDGIPRLPAGRTYQLWSMAGDDGRTTLISSAVLGRAPAVSAFHAPATTEGFVLTDEPAPGVERSRGPVVASGRLD